MLSFIDEHRGRVHAVLVYDYSRLARNTAHHLEIRTRLNRHKIRLISITQPVTDDPFGEFQETLHASLARLDNRIRAERTKAGMVAAVEQGRWCHQAPVGYLNCGRNASPSLRPDPNCAALVAEAFDRVAGGEAAGVVHADLIRRGLTTRRGRAVSRTAFYVLLGNPVYAGELRTKLGVATGDWEPLVEPSIWRRVQTTISRRTARPSSRTRGSKRPYRRLRPDFELRGFLKCAECGKKVTGGVTKGHAYLHCPQGHVRGRAAVIQERFCEWLGAVRPNEIMLQRLTREIRAVWTEQQAALDRQQKAHGRRVVDLEAKLARLNDGFLAGNVDGETYRQLHSSLKAELAVAEHGGVEMRLARLDLDPVLQFAEHLLSRPERWWLDASSEDRVGLQQTLFPDGLLIDQALNYSIPSSASGSISCMLFSGDRKDVASHAELSWNQAIAWLRNMAALRENPVFTGDSAVSGRSTSPSNTGVSTP